MDELQLRNQQSRMRKLFLIAAWVSLAAIAYATLSRVGLVLWLYNTIAPLIAHPSIGAYVHAEHIIAFAVLGALFSMAYPRSTRLVFVFVLGIAAGLEALQGLTPDRHANLPDCLEKIAGGAVGTAIGRLIGLLFWRTKPIATKVE
jgi:VanZ like family